MNYNGFSYELFVSEGLFTNTFGYIDILCTSILYYKDWKNNY